MSNKSRSLWYNRMHVRRRALEKLRWLKGLDKPPKVGLGPLHTFLKTITREEPPKCTQGLHYADLIDPKDLLFFVGWLGRVAHKAKCPNGVVLLRLAEDTIRERVVLGVLPDESEALQGERRMRRYEQELTGEPFPRV